MQSLICLELWRFQTDQWVWSKMFLKFGITEKAFIVERELFYFRLFLVKIDAKNDENLSLVLWSWHKTHFKRRNHFRFQGNEKSIMLSEFNHFFDFALDRFQLDGKEFFWEVKFFVKSACFGKYIDKYSDCVISGTYTSIGRYMHEYNRFNVVF